MEHNPLEHFQLYNILSLHLGIFDISINKAVLMMWLVSASVILFFMAAGRSVRLIPGKFQNLAEIAMEFLRNMVLENMGEKGLKFVPFVATLFFFILFSNLLGLIPGFYTVTSQLIVTAGFAALVYLISIGVGFLYHGFGFLHILIPPGTPGWLLPLMIPIEIVSQLARPVSLAVRLFANMTAGHTVLGVLLGMAISLGFLIGWLPFGFSVAINLLEVGIAFIQAYIFTILTTVYLGDAIKMEH
ncbi:MAG: F0F1 ATP synthase subunit A [Nitrospirae bacterium]|nr:F0F1 ATP synthase subunit A [Nitrospirota bacterium]MBI3595228.1 F0F1 ATP synthase subunit A [Nitrospirota bacterium]